MARPQMAHNSALGLTREGMLGHNSAFGLLRQMGGGDPIEPDDPGWKGGGGPVGGAEWGPPKFAPGGKGKPAPGIPAAVGPEQYGAYAPSIDPKQMGVDKSLNPRRAFKGTSVGGGMFTGGGLGGLAAPFGGSSLGGGLSSILGGGGDMTSLAALLAQYLMPELMAQLKGPITGGR